MIVRFLWLGIIFIFLQHAPEAQATCRDRAAQGRSNRLMANFLIGATGTIEYTGSEHQLTKHLILTDPHRANQLRNQGIATIAGTAATIAIVALTSRARHFEKVLYQADACKGRRLNKLYQRYKRQQSAPVPKEQFCDAIVQLDQEEAFCHHGLPTKMEITDIVSDFLAGDHK